MIWGSPSNAPSRPPPRVPSFAANTQVAGPSLTTSVPNRVAFSLLSNLEPNHGPRGGRPEGSRAAAPHHGEGRGPHPLTLVLAAATPKDFEDLAVRLVDRGPGGAFDALLGARARLRELIVSGAAPLFDQALYASELERGLGAVWEVRRNQARAMHVVVH